MTDAAELSDLEGLTTHPGWYRMRSMFDGEWGVAGKRYIDTLERIAKQPMSQQQDRDQAMQDMQVVIKAREAMHAFLAGVESRAKQLKNQTEPAVSQSRRGML